MANLVVVVLMRRLVTGMTTNRGFTLIELLIVIVIIGITVGFALISFGDFGGSKRIAFAAEQLGNTLHLAQQQAILESSTLGLQIDNNSYKIVKYQNSSGWSSGTNKVLYKVYYFPQNTSVTLKTNNKPARGFPAVIIDSSGEMTPFTIMVGTEKNSTIMTITGNHDGTIIYTSGQAK